MGAEEQLGFLTAAIEVHHRVIVVGAAFAPFPDAHQLRDQLGQDRFQHVVIVTHRRTLGVGLFLGDDDGTVVRVLDGVGEKFLGVLEKVGVVKIVHGGHSFGRMVEVCGAKQSYSAYTMIRLFSMASLSHSAA